MTTILNKMGIQQWRLRPDPDAVSPRELGSADNHQPAQTPENGLQIERAPVTGDVRNSAKGYPQTVGLGADHIGNFVAPDSNLIEARALIKKPNNAAATGAKKEGGKSLDAVKPTRVPTSMPTPMPAPISIPIPASTSAPIDAPRTIENPVPDLPAGTMASAPAPISENDARLIEPPQARSTVNLGPIDSLDWQGLQTLIDGKNQCPSCGPGSSNLGAGDPKANFFFVSDAPTNTDLGLQQLFSGRAGQLFEAMLFAVGLDRESVYTTSVFKCVASSDLSVTPSCDKLLNRQIDLVKPKVVISFGEFTSQAVAKSNQNLEQLRAQKLICHRSKVPIVASYSPLQLLENPLLKAKAWRDLKKCIAIAQA
jgi:DNA polymerase